MLMGPMNEFDQYPIHGDDPIGGPQNWKHPGEIEVEHVEEGRIEVKNARDLPLETAFKKVDGRYRPVMKIKVFGAKGARRLESFDGDGNLIATVVQ